MYSLFVVATEGRDLYTLDGLAGRWSIHGDDTRRTHQRARMNLNVVKRCVLYDVTANHTLPH